MRNIIIYNPDSNLVNYYKSIIEGLYNIDATVLSNSDDIPSALKDQDVAIINYGDEKAETLVKYCLDHSPKIPCIITGDESKMSEAKSKFKTQGLLDYFSHHENIELLFTMINRFSNLHQRSLNQKKYCKVNINFFFSSSNVFCDIYLRVGESKFVKIFNRYDPIDIKDVKKYNQKNVNYLYVRENDFALIMKKLVEQLKPLMESSGEDLTLGTSQIFSTFSIQLQETVYESIQTLGLSNEAIEMTNVAINSTLDLVQSDSEIFKILHDVIRGKNYISEHSFLLAYISGAMVKESPYAHPDNTLALSVAAFFHDITLDTPQKAKITNVKDFKFSTISLKGRNEVLEHPIKSAELVKQINGIPEVVQTMILQHHESYDGKGFPNGIDYMRTHPLSAIFNVAHELADYFFESGQDPQNITDIIDDLTNKYLRGNYKMAIEAAHKVFCKKRNDLIDEKKAV